MKETYLTVVKFALKNYEETKQLNFYNVGGIRFRNLAANDNMITSMINTMVT